MASTYFCIKCGADHDNPKTISVCSKCGGVDTVKVRSAVVECAKARGAVSTALENNDLAGFTDAKTNLASAADKLKPPSSR